LKRICASSWTIAKNRYISSFNKHAAYNVYLYQISLYIYLLHLSHHVDNDNSIKHFTRTILLEFTLLNYQNNFTITKLLFDCCLDYLSSQGMFRWMEDLFFPQLSSSAER